jgi:hypothetical protein
MKLIANLFAGGLALCAFGCVAHVGVAEPEPVAVGYTTYDYEPVYYDRGWYDGGYWYWHGRDGRLYHERREARERHYGHGYGHERHERY